MMSSRPYGQVGARHQLRLNSAHSAANGYKVLGGWREQIVASQPESRDLAPAKVGFSWWAHFFNCKESCKMKIANWLALNHPPTSRDCVKPGLGGSRIRL